MSVADHPVRVAYFVQTHRQPEHVLRLLTRLREGSPQAALIVGHCPTAPALETWCIRQPASCHDTASESWGSTPCRRETRTIALRT